MTSAVAPEIRTASRSSWLVPLLVAVVAFIVISWASAPYIVGVHHDDGVYALLAKSLATGQGFRFLQLPGLPAAAHFPPLYPLVLAVVWRLNPGFPDNIPSMLALNALFVAVAALTMHQLLRRWFGWRTQTAAAVTLAALLSVPVLSLGSALLSEPLYLAGLAPTLFLAQRAVDRDDARSALLSGLAIGLMMLIRTHAVALLGAAALPLVVRRDWRRALLLGGTTVAVQLPWLLWCRVAAPAVVRPLNGAYGAYPEFFKEGWRAGGLSVFTLTAQANLHELWLLLGDRVWGGMPRGLGLTCVLLLGGLMLAGAWRAARRAPVLPLFLALHFAVLLIMSCAPPRYSWVVWPLLFVLAVLGAESMLRRAPHRAARIVVLAVIALPFAAMARTELHAYLTHEWNQPARNASRAIAPAIEWIRRNTPADAVVLVEGEEIATLFTGRLAAPPLPFRAVECVVPATVADNRRGLLEMLAVVPAQYVVSVTSGVVAAARTMPQLRLVDSLPGVAMFEVHR